MRTIRTALAVAIFFLPLFAYAGSGGGGSAPVTNVNGSLDSALCSTSNAVGWAQDTDTPTQAVNIYFWIDSTPSSYTSTDGSVGSAIANQYRADLCTSLGSCNHGYTFVIPDRYFDNTQHSISAYGEDTGSANGAELSNDPQTFTCPPPPSCTVTFDQNPLAYGGSTTVHWNSTHAVSMYVNSIGYVTPNTAGSAKIYSGGGGLCTSPSSKVVTLTSGTSWAVPLDWNSSNNSIELWGAGGGGGGDGGGSAGSDGKATTFNSTLSAGPGKGGASGSSGTPGGAGGGASGGTSNTSGVAGAAAAKTTSGAGGSAPSGGAGGASLSTDSAGLSGASPGGGGGGGCSGSLCGSSYGGAGGGSGAYVRYNNLALSSGNSITYQIGSGGGGGTGTRAGGAGAGGKIVITYTPAAVCSTTSDYSCTAQGSQTKRSTSALLTITPPPAPTASITAGSPTVLVGASTNITATFSAGSPDVLSGDNIDSPVGTGLGASSNPDAQKIVAFSPTLPGVYTFYARALTSFFNSWTTYGTVTVTVPVPPTATISVSPGSIAQGQTATLSWSSTNATGCTISSIGAVGPSGSTTVSPSQPTTYTGSCTGPGGTTPFNTGLGITLTVSCTPSYTCSGTQTIVHTVSNCSTTQTSCVSPAFCSAGSAVCLYPPPTFIQSGGGSGLLTGHLQASPVLLAAGKSTTVTWDVGNVSSCTVTNSVGNDSWTGLSGSHLSAPINQQTMYTLACAGLDGSTVNETATVNILPVFQER